MSLEETLKRFTVIAPCWYQQWLPTKHGQAPAEMGQQQLLLGLLRLLTLFSGINEEDKGTQFKQKVVLPDV